MQWHKGIQESIIKKMRNLILNTIKSIQPFDEIEQRHIADAVWWINSGEEIFRIKKPDIPPKHLVSYFALIDPKQRKVLLMDHIKAGLWLPSGGHVEPNEHPKTTVEREIIEELNQPANFLLDEPIFITQMITVGKTAGHTDVCLWYVVKGDAQKPIDYDSNEFNGYKWFGYEEVLDEDIRRFDPHMHRFTKKLLTLDLID